MSTQMRTWLWPLLYTLILLGFVLVGEWMAGFNLMGVMEGNEDRAATLQIEDVAPIDDFDKIQAAEASPTVDEETESTVENGDGVSTGTLLEPEELANAIAGEADGN